MTTSARMLITQMSATQNNRSVTVNAMLAMLEAAGGIFSAIAVGTNTPPGSPAEGDLYIIGTSPTGAWASNAKNAAILFNASWYFIPPIKGYRAFDQTSSAKYIYDGSAWTAEANSLAKATAANIWAATADKALTSDNIFAAAVPVALTDAATIAVDMSTFLNATVTLGGNRTLGAPSNVKDGQSGCIEIVQDGTGSRTLAYHADWKFAGGSAPTLSTAAGSRDLLFYQVLSTGKTYANLVKAV